MNLVAIVTRVSSCYFLVILVCIVSDSGQNYQSQSANEVALADSCALPNKEVAVGHITNDPSHNSPKVTENEAM
jgi:hypothetical protein